MGYVATVSSAALNHNSAGSHAFGTSVAFQTGDIVCVGAAGSVGTNAAIAGTNTYTLVTDSIVTANGDCIAVFVVTGNTSEDPTFSSDDAFVDMAWAVLRLTNLDTPAVVGNDGDTTADLAVAIDASAVGALLAYAYANAETSFSPDSNWGELADDTKASGNSQQAQWRYDDDSAVHILPASSVDIVAIALQFSDVAVARSARTRYGRRRVGGR